MKALSGGERNRLLLARLLTRPANVLVLDEPTNDLDLETLEILEAELATWQGTLLLVSHDRTFLDNVVTSTLALEGEGRVREYVGGYQDWLRQRTAPGVQGVRPDVSLRKPAESGRSEPVKAAAPVAAAAAPARKLSYREQKEFDGLPARIETLEAEQRELAATIAAPAFYASPQAAIAAALSRFEEIPGELAVTYARWDALESRVRRV